MEPAAADNRSLASLFSELSREASDLIRQEIALARAEALEKVDQVRSGAIALVAGGLVVLVGLYFLFQALAFGVAALLANAVGEEIAIWLAPLLVGLLAALIGAGVLVRGVRNLSRADLAPRQTAHSLRRDADLVREHVR